MPIQCKREEGHQFASQLPQLLLVPPLGRLQLALGLILEGNTNVTGHAAYAGYFHPPPPTHTHTHTHTHTPVAAPGPQPRAHAPAPIPAIRVPEPVKQKKIRNQKGNFAEF